MVFKTARDLAQYYYPTVKYVCGKHNTRSEQLAAFIRITGLREHVAKRIFSLC